MKLAIMGYGVVGSGVAALLQTNQQKIQSNAMHQKLELTKILDLREFPGDPFESYITHEFSDILNDPEITLVAETMGGIHPAFDYVLALLRAGKSVVTSNKELVAAKGFALLQAATEHNVNFLFEASVGGGIPILRPLSQCLSANTVTEVSGILNGTTNFILTKMFEEKMPFAEALQRAQELGYAERNPAADIDGHDACRKISILATLAFGTQIYPEFVQTTGISSLELQDVQIAQQNGYAVKLLARAIKTSDGRVRASVEPTLLPETCLLSQVRDVYNAVLVRGDAVGDVVFYGRGAGALPTASAVVADLIDCAKHTERRRYLSWKDGDASALAPADEAESAFYIRITTNDLPAATAALFEIFGEELSVWNAPGCFLTPLTTQHKLFTSLIRRRKLLELQCAYRVFS